MPVNEMNAKVAVAETEGERVLQDQHGYQQSEAQPYRLDPPHPQRAADVDRPESQRKVDRKGAVENTVPTGLRQIHSWMTPPHSIASHEMLPRLWLRKCKKT